MLQTVLIITQIFNFASFVDYAAHARYLSIYYILSFVSTGAKGNCPRQRLLAIYISFNVIRI
jgi:hypothetical protein